MKAQKFVIDNRFMFGHLQTRSVIFRLAAFRVLYQFLGTEWKRQKFLPSGNNLYEVRFSSYGYQGELDFYMLSMLFMWMQNLDSMTFLMIFENCHLRDFSAAGRAIKSFSEQNWQRKSFFSLRCMSESQYFFANKFDEKIPPPPDIIMCASPFSIKSSLSGSIHT